MELNNGRSLRDEWLLMVDGAARGNPGEAGCGAAIFSVDRSVVKELSRYLGRVTNNVAEYEGAIDGARSAAADGRKEDTNSSDSQLLVRNSVAVPVKDEKLKGLFSRAMELLRQFDSYRTKHVSRDANKLADRLANRGIDQALQRAG